MNIKGDWWFTIACWIGLVAVLFVCAYMSGCAVNLEMRVGQRGEMADSMAAVDTVRQAIIIMTKKDSIVTWHNYYVGLKNELWIHAVKSLRIHGRAAREVEWDGDYVTVVHLKLVVWGGWSNTTETLDFTWYYDPIKGTWDMQEEEE